MPSIAEILKEAAEVLHSGGVIEPRREAESLLAFHLQKNKTFLIAHPEFELTQEDEFYFYQLILRRTHREPFQHIKGYQEFYGLDFEVNSDVLIPRPETEMIVENAIEILRDLQTPRFCEVGTGSGCISVSILYHVPQALAVGLDISAEALEMTRRNAEKHRVSERLKLRNSDVFSALDEAKFDLIVSNPPYIPSEEIPYLQPEVRDFEPVIALTDGRDGLSIIERIITGAPEFLHPDGFLLMEIGFNQAEKVRQMFSTEIWASLEILPDLQGIPRMVKGRIKN
jgi:release factor glutamine methyltransferase